MEKKELQVTVGDAVLPKDFFTIEDKVYGDRHYIREGGTYKEVTKPPVVPVRVHVDRRYVMNDPTSFIAAIQKCGGDKEKGIIFYEGSHGENRSHVTMFFSEDSRAEWIKLPLRWSLELNTFLGKGAERTYDQKGMLKALDTFPECVKSEDIAVLRANIERLQVSTKIDYESNLDPNNLVFKYQEKSGGDQTGRIPKKLTLELPFYEGSPNKVTIEVDFEVTMPKEENSKPALKLSNVKHERTERDALMAEIASLKIQLPGWTFINGQ